MTYEENTNTMKAFFEGRIRNDIPESKLVELGHGKGVGHTRGSYNQYIKELSAQRSKGNGTISIGKYVIEKDIFSIPDQTDKFTVGDIPHLLVIYGNIISDIQLKAVWKNSIDDTILEQYYNIPGSYSMGNDWWDKYSVYFIGPEDLDEGDYNVIVTSREVISREPTLGDKDDNIKTLSASLEFSVVDIS